MEIVLIYQTLLILIELKLVDFGIINASILNLIFSVVVNIFNRKVIQLEEKALPNLLIVFHDMIEKNTHELSMDYMIWSLKPVCNSNC